MHAMGMYHKPVWKNECTAPMSTKVMTAVAGTVARPMVGHIASGRLINHSIMLRLVCRV